MHKKKYEPTNIFDLSAEDMATMSDEEMRELQADLNRAKQIHKITEGFTAVDYENLLVAVVKKYETTLGQKFFI